MDLLGFWKERLTPVCLICLRLPQDEFGERELCSNTEELWQELEKAPISGAHLNLESCPE